MARFRKPPNISQAQLAAALAGTGQPPSAANRFVAMTDPIVAIPRQYDHTKALTEGVPTQFLILYVPPDTWRGLEIDWMVEASDGTNHQMVVGKSVVVGLNKSMSSVVSSIEPVMPDITAVSSGTLTATPTVVNGTGTVGVYMEGTSSLAQTVLNLSYKAYALTDLTSVAYV